jgi:hypothetical protein
VQFGIAQGFPERSLVLRPPCGVHPDVPCDVTTVARAISGARAARSDAVPVLPVGVAAIRGGASCRSLVGRRTCWLIRLHAR